MYTKTFLSKELIPTATVGVVFYNILAAAKHNLYQIRKDYLLMKNEKMGVEDLYLAPEKENEAVNDIDSNSATQTSDGSSNKYISKKKV